VLTTQGTRYLEAAGRLHSHILERHWDGQKLVGPDPVGKIHWRFTRFVRSYCPRLPGDDRLVYLQGQAYWILANLLLHELTQEARYLSLARRCADFIASSQPPDGAWRHPPIWGRRGYISTVEGVWASIGLIAAYRVTAEPAHLESALRWYDCQLNKIGFQQVGTGLAANYYSHSTIAVPNVTTMLIRLLTALYEVVGDPSFLSNVDGMLRFIQSAQTPTGELPYVFPTRTHFMCYQYNAFQFLDLAEYYRGVGNPDARPILSKMATYLSTGVTERGSCRYDCFKELPEVNYWTAVLAAALCVGHQMEFGDYEALSERAHQYLIGQQRPGGGFDFSRMDLGFLRDRRSYPRYLAMTLYHILCRAETDGQERGRRAGDTREERVATEALRVSSWLDR